MNLLGPAVAITMAMKVIADPGDVCLSPRCNFERMLEKYPSIILGGDHGYTPLNQAMLDFDPQILLEPDPPLRLNRRGWQFLPHWGGGIPMDPKTDQAPLERRLYPYAEGKGPLPLVPEGDHPWPNFFWHPKLPYVSAPTDRPSAFREGIKTPTYAETAPLP